MLLTSIDVIKQATEKYYEDTHKFYVEIAADVESKQEIEERKAEILREGNKKMDLWQTKKKGFAEKKFGVPITFCFHYLEWLTLSTLPTQH